MLQKIAFKKKKILREARLYTLENNWNKYDHQHPPNVCSFEIFPVETSKIYFSSDTFTFYVFYSIKLFYSNRALFNFGDIMLLPGRVTKLTVSVCI